MKKKSDTAGYQFGVDVQIKDIAALKERLLSLVEEDAACYEMDASRIHAIDMAGLQLLTAFAKELEQKNVQLAWNKPTPYFDDAVRLSGLAQCLCIEK